MRKTEFKKTLVEICRNCHGSGAIGDDDDPLYEEACPVCAGSGRVKKTTEGTVTVEPYGEETIKTGG